MAAPTYDDLIEPLFIAMHGLGGSASIDEQEEKVAEIMELTDEQLSEIHRDNKTKFSYRLAWARTYLKRFGVLTNSKRGVWALTAEGQKKQSVSKDEVKKYVQGEEMFCFTYGDGVADIDIGELVSSHKSSGLQATVTAIQPPGRYGAMHIDNGKVQHFQEKPAGDGAWINGGFFVLEPSVLEYIDGDDTIWEQQPLQCLAGQGQLSAFQHGGFWQAMDTLREKNILEDLWSSGRAPWKSW